MSVKKATSIPGAFRQIRTDLSDGMNEFITDSRSAYFLKKAVDAYNESFQGLDVGSEPPLVLSSTPNDEDMGGIGLRVRIVINPHGWIPGFMSRSLAAEVEEAARDSYRDGQPRFVRCSRSQINYLRTLVSSFNLDLSVSVAEAGVYLAPKDENATNLKFSDSVRAAIKQLYSTGCSVRIDADKTKESYVRNLVSELSAAAGVKVRCSMMDGFFVLSDPKTAAMDEMVALALKNENNGLVSISELIARLDSLNSGPLETAQSMDGEIEEELI